MRIKTENILFFQIVDINRLPIQNNFKSLFPFLIFHNFFWLFLLSFEERYVETNTEKFSFLSIPYLLINLPDLHVFLLLFNPMKKKNIVFFLKTKTLQSLSSSNSYPTVDVPPLVTSQSTNNGQVEKKWSIPPKIKEKYQYYYDDACLDFGVVLDLLVKQEDESLSSLEMKHSVSVGQIVVDPTFIRKISAVIRSTWDVAKEEIKKTKRIPLVMKENNNHLTSFISLEIIVRSSLYIADALLNPRDHQKLTQFMYRHSGGRGGEAMGLESPPCYSLDLWIKIGEFGHEYIDDNEFGLATEFESLISHSLSQYLGCALDYKGNKNKKNDNKNNIRTEDIL